MPIDGTHLTEAERTVLGEAIDRYLTALDRVIARRMMSRTGGNSDETDDAVWRQYVAMELRAQAERR